MQKKHYHKAHVVKITLTQNVLSILAQLLTTHHFLRFAKVKIYNTYACHVTVLHCITCMKSFGYKLLTDGYY